MDEAINKRDQQLFSAFTLSRQDLLEKKLSYDFEDLRSVTEAFNKYCTQLENMGKHQLFIG